MSEVVPNARDEISVEVGLDAVDDDEAIRRAVAKSVGCRTDDLGPLHVRRRSIDARRGTVRFRLLVALGERLEPAPRRPPRPVDHARRVVVVGDGPAGLFCAYELARAGIASVVLDRGHKVQPRRRDLKKLNQHGIVDSDSNYCFGEGGAGTYSDGKLYTRANKRGNVADVIGTLLSAGAPAQIGVDARPHIGSNKLPKVVTAIREQLEEVGVEFRFESRVVELLLDRNRHAKGVVLANGDAVDGDAVVLATGHSARDIFSMLLEARVTLESKPFALGVRIEHPQPLINEIQYGRAVGHPRLPSASYRVSCQVRERGVFSFCMCPGGWIVPASTEAGGLVVNGMSLSRRDSLFANSGLVVAIEAEDVQAAGERGPLAGIALQRSIEQAADSAGGGALRAPATRLTDFLTARASSTVPGTSYIPGLAAGDISEVLDASGLNVSARLRDGLRTFASRMRGYLTEDAVLVGVESRTSCPVRIPRGAEDLESPDIPGLYPCGEGAGYAGGIVSAALDGMRVAAAIAKRW